MDPPHYDRDTLVATAIDTAGSDDLGEDPSIVKLRPSYRRSWVRAPKRIHAIDLPESKTSSCTDPSRALVNC